FTMDSKLERTCIKFCCKNEIKCSDTLKMLQKCYGDDTLSKTQVYQWYERFKSGREAVEDDARPGRPSTSKTDENVDEILLGPQNLEWILLNDEEVSEERQEGSPVSEDWIVSESTRRN
ncbi:GVQW3 protein, partial [Acromyrmex charruanus]